MTAFSRLAATAAFVALALAAPSAAQRTNTTNPCTALNSCVETYSTELQKPAVQAQIQAGNIRAMCDPLQEVFTCLQTFIGRCFAQFGLNSSITSDLYAQSFAQSGCDGSAPIIGESRIIGAFGDPHYTLLNGTLATCNAPGWHLFAETKYWSVRVHHTAVAGGRGAVIDKVDLVMMHPWAPTERFEWSLTSTPLAKLYKRLSITPTGFAALKSLDFLLGVKKVAAGDALSVSIGVHDQMVTDGLLLKGCPGEAQPAALNATAKAALPDACKGLSEGEQRACAFDQERMGATWAGKAAESVKEVEKEVAAAASSATRVVTLAATVASALLALLL